MTGLLAELGRKLAERWFTLLVLPGLVYLLVAAAAVRLGQGDWHDWRALWDGFTDLTEGDPGRQEGGLVARAVLLILAAIPVSAAVGALAQALAGPVEQALCGPWPRPFANFSAHLTTRRESAWNAADAAYRSESALAEEATRRQLMSTQAARRDERQAAQAGAAGTPPADPEGTHPDTAHADIAAHHTRNAATHAARRNALSLIRPEHPTRLGDRLHAPAVRLGAEYGIDLAVVWPRLWLLLPASTRETLTATRTRLDAAFALGGWALLYLPLALLWWPAGLVALGAALVSRRRAALAAEAYAELVEATVDLHLDRLHSRLAEPRPSPQQGRALTERLRRGL
ncbi:hypothetical protein [Streptomyces sp. NPDC001536]|uniref:hypothetical protein n=1 Tax=Streptomyces sp. NPDC001536 TaxID=3364583 RepID=UPI0036768480